MKCSPFITVAVYWWLPLAINLSNIAVLPQFGTKSSFCFTFSCILSRFFPIYQNGISLDL